jgi:hypothetical protein
MLIDAATERCVDILASEAIRAVGDGEPAIQLMAKVAMVLLVTVLQTEAGATGLNTILAEATLPWRLVKPN